MEKILHIVCLDIPYPADYGGVIDMYYRIESLFKAGIGIHLHCYEYNRKPAPELNRFCKSVTYYKRNTSISALRLHLPYIVSSRINEKLVMNLAADDYPILLEGIHCAFIVNDSRIRPGRIWLRAHNIEHLYYHNLAESTKNWIKKLYYRFESWQLKRYEPAVLAGVHVLTVTEADRNIIVNEYGGKTVYNLPSFVPFREVKIPSGVGKYCLYHGNLSVAENERAVIYLMKEVFSKLDIPFVIAGKDPSELLKNEVNRDANSCLAANPDEVEMEDIIEKAQIHLLPSFNNTGLKLKLVRALFTGRHCITNLAMVEGTGLENCVHIANDSNSIHKAITDLYRMPVAHEEISLRKKILEGMFSNEKKTEALIRLLW